MDSLTTTVNGQSVAGAACSWDKSAFKGCTEGPFGFPVSSKVAKELETLAKDLPADDHHGFKRIFVGGTVKEMSETDRTDISVITSDAVDRDREVMNVRGLNLDQFRKNPVVTWAHRYDMLPVGKCMWIKPEGSAVKAKTRYSTKPDGWGSEWFPDAVWHMIQSGDLKGKSIGCLRRKGHSPTPDEIRARPDFAEVRWIYDEVILCEYAVATVQSNPEAVVEAIAKGVVSDAIMQKLGLTMPKPDPALKHHPVAPLEDISDLPLPQQQQILQAAIDPMEAAIKMLAGCVPQQQIVDALKKHLDNAFSADTIKTIVQERLDHFCGRV